MFGQLYLALCALQAVAHAYSVPPNLQTFYNTVSKQKNCTHTLKSGFGNGDNDYPLNWAYCELDNVMYIHYGGGGLGSMAIDVDGRRPKGDNPQDSQDGTAFEDTLRSYNISGVKDLDPYIHPYVVLGNQGTKKGYLTFDPHVYGVQPLSVVAVVCNGKLFYGVWGDTNGDDDYPKNGASTGEASQALGTACFGKHVSANIGHGKPDVLYVAFKGATAVPGAKGADWAAKSYDEFEASIKQLGDKLVSQISLGSPTATATVWSPTLTGTALSSALANWDGQSYTPPSSKSTAISKHKTGRQW
ncbi:fungal chitosanase of glycosyl hydrolase group 75-domain-containing protein [Neohortaea acidophila]|uniref:Endo-chitosanase n=1 Tax=Neohortaea acidophila TaxID=245834 RepID=A0A6A6PV20_9PEZI|nr:fungal chitosanase of glycosyl hydrolase group 75-domain-containing protein [Neohortaea acidophila]KAF2483571.1 fungal chitosanase of glycosyl hydrolase group 75-domain-containing protein [Neohortaea acidophila]